MSSGFAPKASRPTDSIVSSKAELQNASFFGTTRERNAQDQQASIEATVIRGQEDRRHV
jgi:hypothetical protein